MKTRRMCLLAAVLFSAPMAAAEQARPPVPDADGDGVVTFEEFQDYRVARAFANDKNGDGALTLEEFRPALPARLPRMMHGRAFGRIDADGDGYVVPAELEAAPARAFEKADKNSDGELSPDELQQLRAQ